MQVNLHYSQLNSYNALSKKPSSQKEYAKKTSFGINASSLKNASNRATSHIALGLGKIAALKPTQKLVDFLKDKNYQEHLAAFVGCVLSGFYMLDTAKSKTIEKEQKFPLILNQGVVCAMSTVGAYTLNNFLNKKLNHAAELFHIAQIEDPKLQNEFLKCKTDYSYINELQKQAKTNPEIKPIFGELEKKFEYSSKEAVYLKEEIKKHKNDETAKLFLKEIKKIKAPAGKDKADTVKELFLNKMNNSKAMKAAYERASMNNAISKLSGLKTAGRLANMINGFRTAQALVIFALIYRFVAPVFATPIANKMSEKIAINRKEKEAQLQKTA